MPEHGILVDYEYCTGCNACEVACKQEYHRSAGKAGGVRVLELVQELPGGKMDITYFPMFTPLCIFCSPRVEKGLSPACVKHCMAECLTFGPLKDLAGEIPQGRKTVLWAEGNQGGARAPSRSP